METQPIERKKFCPNCGEVFSCFSDKCWCSKLPNIMPLTETSQCMCPKCLEIVIQDKIDHADEEQKEMLFLKSDK